MYSSGMSSAVGEGGGGSSVTSRGRGAAAGSAFVSTGVLRPLRSDCGDAAALGGRDPDSDGGFDTSSRPIRP